MPKSSTPRLPVALRRQLAWLLSSPILLWSGLWLVAMFLTALATLSLLEPGSRQPSLNAADRSAPPSGAVRDDEEIRMGTSTETARPVAPEPPPSGWPLSLELVLAIAALSASGSLVATLLMRLAAKRPRPPRSAAARPPSAAARPPSAAARPPSAAARPPSAPPPSPSPAAPSPDYRPAQRGGAAAPCPVPEPAAVPEREVEIVAPVPQRRSGLAEEFDLRKRYSLRVLLQNRPAR